MKVPDNDILIDLYRRMVLMRRFEEAVARTYREGHIPGFVHLYIGEEAVGAGVIAHLKSEDLIGSTHRGHGHALSKGVPAKQLMAELWGRRTGCSGGRGGSMHLYSKSHGLLGTNGIVGYGIPMATGAAYSAKYRGTSQVAVAFFGDGANNHGLFHETLNLSSIWQLPVVFVCENNLYATEMPFLNATAGRSVATRATAYDIPGHEVDGQDVLAVYETAGQAIERARAGEGPSLIECLTYRYVGHHEGDPGTDYRTKEEVDEWRKRDPISLYRDRLLQIDGDLTSDLDAIDKEVAQIITEALDFARESPWPSPEDVETGVFANPE
ncbi:MAG: thiamine pyrophosphate-dependent enzyme [Anaerolineales bacterium]|jgi:2-oxoisovalerate dehydrogenase E1 component